MAANADGEVLFELYGARMKSQGLQLVNRGFFLTLITTMIPLTSREDLVEIECGVVHFFIEEGVARSSRGLALKLPDVTLLGGGSIDLESERINFVISSKARKGLGINTNTLAKMIRMGGTIKDPGITTDVSGLVQTGVVVGAALATGGLSLFAQGLRDRTIANAQVCQLAIEDDGTDPVLHEKTQPEK
jgi:hypothetical protein